MSKNIREIVNRFWMSDQLHENEESAAELLKTSEDSRLSLELDPPSDCVEWWASLPVAVQQKWLAGPKTSTMYEAWREHFRHKKAADFARASVGLEGFKLSPDCEDLVARNINGHI